MVRLLAVISKTGVTSEVLQFEEQKMLGDLSHQSKELYEHGNAVSVAKLPEVCTLN